MSEHTKGPIQVSHDHDRALDASDDMVAEFVGLRTTLAEDEANCALFVEAVNVSTETGLSPRELANQRDELRRALTSAAMTAHYHSEKHGMGCYGAFSECGNCKEWRVIITKAEAKPCDK